MHANPKLWLVRETRNGTRNRCFRSYWTNQPGLYMVLAPFHFTKATIDDTPDPNANHRFCGWSEQYSGNWTFFYYMEGRTTEDTATDRHAYVRRASTLINSVPSYCRAQQDAVLELHVYCTWHCQHKKSWNTLTCLSTKMYDLHPQKNTIMVFMQVNKT